MRKSKTESMDKLVEAYLKAAGLDRPLKEQRIIIAWEEVVGLTISKASKNMYIRDGVLYVRIYSSIIKKELSMLKEGLIKALNDKVGDKIIYDIRLV